MGRTNPTYRDWIRRFEERWQSFRRALRRRDQPAFDRLFEHARQHADAAGYTNATEPEIALLLSVLLAHERRIEALEARQTDGEAAIDDGSDGEAAIDDGSDGEAAIDDGSPDSSPSQP